MYRFLDRSSILACRHLYARRPKPKGGGCGRGNLYIEKALLDALCLTHRNLAVLKQLSNIKATMAPMGMLYPTRELLIAFIRLDAVVVVYIHIGVGFGVARLDNWAMPEPLCVGWVTGRFPRFFYM